MRLYKPPPLNPANDWRAFTLGRYDDEVARGIVHTKEWKAWMAEVQLEFESAQREYAELTKGETE